MARKYIDHIEDMYEGQMVIFEKNGRTIKEARISFYDGYIMLGNNVFGSPYAKDFYGFRLGLVIGYADNEADTDAEIDFDDLPLNCIYEHEKSKELICQKN